MSAQSEALVMADPDGASERERRKLEAREAQAMLDSLEPGSDQAAKLIESASRKGIKLRVRHTLVDRTAIESLADGLRRDYEQHQAELAEHRRRKLLRIGVALGVAMLVAAAVVVVSGLYMGRPNAPAPSAASEPAELRATLGGTGAEIAPIANPPMPPTAGTAETTQQPMQPASKPSPALCPSPTDAAVPTPAAPPGPKAAEPAPADASPKPAPSNKIEPYFGATP